MHREVHSLNGVITEPPEIVIRNIRIQVAAENGTMSAHGEHVMVRDIAQEEG
jgi:hypothetical protein